MISLLLWVLCLQQDGAACALKDKRDPPPPESGLSQDSFVLCMQTKFQQDHFQALGNKLVSIDATHNTTQYAGLQLFTVLVRTSGAMVHFVVLSICGYLCMLHGRCPCHMDIVIKQHRSHNHFFP